MQLLENREEIKRAIKKQTPLIVFALENELSYNRLTATLNGYHVYLEVVEILKKVGFRPRVKSITHKTSRRFKYQYAKAISNT